MTCDRCGALLGGRGPLVAAYYESPVGVVLCCADCPGCLCAAPPPVPTSSAERARRLRERLARPA